MKYEHTIAGRDFSAATIRRLARKGIRVIGKQACPAFDGEVFFSGVAYRLDDNGTHRVRSFAQILEAAQ